MCTHPIGRRRKKTCNKRVPGEGVNACWVAEEWFACTCTLFVGKYEVFSPPYHTLLCVWFEFLNLTLKAYDPIYTLEKKYGS